MPRTVQATGRRGGPSRWTEHLRSACAELEQGLLSRDEYEHRLEEIELELGGDCVIEELPAVNGRPRFLLRSCRTHAVLQRFMLPRRCLVVA